MVRFAEKGESQSMRVADPLGDAKLTHDPAKAQRAFVLRHSDDEEVEGQARERDANADEGVDGITVKWHSHQEDGTEAEDDGEEKAELGHRGNSSAWVCPLRVVYKSLTL